MRLSFDAASDVFGRPEAFKSLAEPEGKEPLHPIAPSTASPLRLALAGRLLLVRGLCLFGLGVRGQAVLYNVSDSPIPLFPMA